MIRSLLPIFLLSISSFAAAADKPQPNILIILIDDLGKEWIHCYGAEGIETPHIDALAAGGLRFNNAWCMPQCTPTRVTLLTGQYPFRHGWTNHWDVPRWGAGGHFDAQQNTSFANVLRTAGYATCAAGKWQIDDFRVEPDAMDQAGFDEWCMWTGFEGQNPPSQNRYWDAYVNRRGAGSRVEQGRFGPDVYCEQLIDFIDSHRDRPMLLYYPMALTHGPLTTTPDNRDETDKRRLFAGMVRYADKLVGRLVAALDAAGLREETIIFLTTDNGTGGNSNRRQGRMVRGGKAKMSEQNGTAMPFIVNCPGTVPAGQVTDALVDFSDILPTFPELGQAHLPADRIVDGKSFAKLLLGQAENSEREWILSMGGGAATLRDGRVVPKLSYDDRVIRDARFKLWIDTQGKPAALFDLREDPWEETDLLGSEDPEAQQALQRFSAIVSRFPDRDAAPTYRQNPPQPWDQREKASRDKPPTR